MEIHGRINTVLVSLLDNITISADRTRELKEEEKLGKYQNLATELEKIVNHEDEICCHYYSRRWNKPKENYKDFRRT